MAKKKQPPDELTVLQMVAMSLGTPELRHGLDQILTLAMAQASQHEDWDQLDLMGKNEYDKACITAAHAWIKRVTGITHDVFLKQRDRK